MRIAVRDRTELETSSNAVMVEKGALAKFFRRSGYKNIVAVRRLKNTA